MRRSENPLERKLITLYEGDWIELDEILAGRMTPTEFIRRVVRKTIVKAKHRREQVSSNLDHIDAGEYIK